MQFQNHNFLCSNIYHRHIYVGLQWLLHVCLQEEQTGDITFYMKGADVVMQTIVQYNDWLEEEVGIAPMHQAFSPFHE